MVPMAEQPQDTIAAIATPPGEGGIAVVRVSGPAARDLITSLLHLDPSKLKPRSVRLAHVHGRGRVLDEVLAVWMPAPRSYTREDVLEFQCHGGHAAARMVLDATLAAGARLAEPGEFTLRAFLNGRLDLVQAEAVADVIAARTGAALAVHEELLAGRLSRVVTGWQQRLGNTLAFLEAHLDFADEDDVDTFAPAAPVEELRALLGEMGERLDTFAWGRTSRDGFRVALVGAPNTGKSSLLNAVLREDRAIVSAEPGTTRDAIDAWVNADGVPVHLTDTAGLRASGNAVEEEGVSRARAAAGRADLVVFVTDGSRPLHPEECAEARSLAAGGRTLAVVNKVDLGRVPATTLAGLFGAPPLEVSARTGAGLLELLHTWRERAWGGGGPGTAVPLTRERHQQAIAQAAGAVSRAIGILEGDGYLEVAASELHAARRHLAELLGWGSPEDVLDAVFGAFCVGK
ncbi:MAG: tRNA uridine-5-carboxymethylaminomethyl(34) synthesis GTPase MnmE [Deferrisomatales bacterium]|nr:tRNA uridine-5-carboxymethylaminomethyl(34) synthesis GTPase MnmE [Deferrisomatales bacterium]